jgi:hypothetical protein
VLYRRGAVVAVGGFDQSLRACEDYDLYLRLAARDLTVLMRHDPVGIAARTAYRLLVRFARRRRGAVSLHGQ